MCYMSTAAGAGARHTNSQPQHVGNHEEGVAKGLNVLLNAP